MTKTISSNAKPGQELRVLDGIASWCGGLHGAMPLVAALQALASGLGADMAAIARHYHRSEETPRTVAVSSGPGSRSLKRAYCQDVLGQLFGMTRPATFWSLNELAADDPTCLSSDVQNWQSASGVQEIVVIPLTQSAQTADYIEFHFRRELSQSELKEIDALVPTLVRSWIGRKPGLVTQTAVNDRLAEAREIAQAEKPDWDAPILGPSNPARLSRAEFRVCLLLSRGLAVKAVADELGLTDNTVRSHMRAIYAKTETSNLAELLYRILSSDRAEDAPLRRVINR